MNSFEKHITEFGVGSTDYLHIIVAKRAYIAGMKRAAEIAREIHGDDAVVKTVRKKILSESKAIETGE